MLQSECSCLNKFWEENLLSFLNFSLKSLESATYNLLNRNFQTLVSTMIVSNYLKNYTNFKSSNKYTITNESDGVVICGIVISEIFNKLINKNFSYLVQAKSNYYSRSNNQIVTSIQILDIDCNLKIDLPKQRNDLLKKMKPIFNWIFNL